MDVIVDIIERFRSGLLVFLEGAGPLPLLGLLPFIVFFMAFSIDKLRTGAYVSFDMPTDDEEEPTEGEISSLENAKTGTFK